MFKKKERRPFDEARVFARSLKLRNRREWKEYRKSDERPDDIPAHPDEAYKNDGWNGWVDWLGNEDRIIVFSEEHRRKMSEAMKGKNNPMYGKHHTEETRRKLSEKGIISQNRPERKGLQSQIRANLKIPRKDTKPEIILQKICDDEGIEFVTQKVIKLQHYELHKTIRHKVDVFIDSTEPKICLLADGDVVHANPNRYRTSRTRWVDGIKPDEPYKFAKTSKKYKSNKAKTDADAAITRELEEQDYTVIRFWESDLKHDTEKCRQQIIDAVRKSKEYPRA